MRYSIPESLICPISLALISDPVTLDGRYFERSEIEEFFIHRDNINPLTNKAVENKDLSTQYSAREMIDGFVEQYKEQYKEENPDALSIGITMS